jgi:mRNA interferase YafQ
MILSVLYRKKFKKNLELLVRRGKDPEKIKIVINLLINRQPLAQKHKDHPLSGNFIGFRNCHIEPDWLMIYRIVDDTLYLERTGTHSDLFK